MEPRSLKFIADACGGDLVQGSPGALANGLSTDSRTLEPGQLYIALVGNRFDGHRFLDHAVTRGASAVMINEGTAVNTRNEAAVIVVTDTRKALGLVARRYRQDFDLPIIAVGGSNGKTTVKELLVSALRQKFRTVSSQASFNNDIGVPITLLDLNRSHQVGVLEVGTNHPGELAPLVRMIRPKHGVITSIGREHLEFFGDLSGVVDEECRLAEDLPEDGTLYVNGDCSELRDIERRTRARVVRVGKAESNDWRAFNFQMHETGVNFHVDAPDPAYEGKYSLKLLGEHQAVNALFAVAVGKELGLSRAGLQRGLADCQASKMRLQLLRGDGFLVLDDSYNANEDSVRAALETLARLPCRGRRIAVLGEMAELGAHSELAHAGIGRYAAEFGIQKLFAVGRMASVIARAAREAGLENVVELRDIEAAAGCVRGCLAPGDIVLLKASRFVRMERLTDVLLGSGKPIEG
ncbi:MAG: UDP-N-acetylmuramoyl-tripeptide--D-alanyl-D-alanine ligase [Verrucomicrobia bacterium]|nr:UDP-N-acetylmuramoyl-tripeptide--D-alanyl-D-alanine ligase [Verrucomicrobiota bacterium]